MLGERQENCGVQQTVCALKDGLPKKLDDEGNDGDGTNKRQKQANGSENKAQNFHHLSNGARLYKIVQAERRMLGVMVKAETGQCRELHEKRE